MWINSIEVDTQHVETGLPPLRIWKYELKVPVIQWWMWVGISMSPLAGNVSLNGWAGTLSSAAVHMTPPYKEFWHATLKKAIAWRAEAKKNTEASGKDWSDEDYYSQVFAHASQACIKEEVHKAKDIAWWKSDERGKDIQTWNGPVFINIMNAWRDYEGHVRASCEAWVHGIVSGAWLPLHLPKYVAQYKNKDADVALIPILSNLKWVKTLINFWKSKYNKLPDAIVMEDPSRAGGHLGANGGKLANVYDESTTLEVSIPAVVEYLKQEGIDIPVIAAWWIVTREDADRMFALWAKWVQIWTRFLASHESSAHEAFKDAVINAKKEDIGLYNSSAFYPARYFHQSLEGEDVEGITARKRMCIRQCLSHCARRDGIPWFAQICIVGKLIRSTEWSKGNWLRFTWDYFDPEGRSKITSILSVKEIFETLMQKKDMSKISSALID